MAILQNQLNNNRPSVSKSNTEGLTIYLNRCRQLLHELLTVLVSQQILDGLLLQTGGFLHGVDGVLHSLTDM